MLKDISPKPGTGTVRNARALRQRMTLPEGLVWRALRQRPDGVKFRRQHATGFYILDFYCNDARLAVEIDGEGHSFGDLPVRDAARDAWLERTGVATLRISAADVLRDIDAAVAHILSEVKARLPLHHPSGGPPPRGKLGEE